jgi:hypothetical protein
MTVAPPDDLKKVVDFWNGPGRPGGDQRRPGHGAGVARAPAWLAQFLKVPGTKAEL